MRRDNEMNGLEARGLNSPGRPTKVTFMFAVSITVDVEKFLAVPDRVSPLKVPLRIMAFTPDSVTLQLMVMLAARKLDSVAANERASELIHYEALNLKRTHTT